MEFGQVEGKELGRGGGGDLNQTQSLSSTSAVAIRSRACYIMQRCLVVGPIQSVRSSTELLTE